ncbi:unnamed protein product [Adineta ricciae]|uniref:FHF complex subunit HOOK-interacting protein C-terminal domain-containing protein n=1 Tax=Adineta ricciae TaxID=249248 RepID=A0A815EPY3_ADIRI|nr:unnamed protein product [Adineta ricciae]
MEFMMIMEEVLRQHWKQIQQVLQKSFVNQDDISCVTSHFQHAVTLLTNEVASQDRPGPILLYFISESILDTFFVWSLSCPEYAVELKYHQLRCFEFLLSRSQFELLFHKQIFKPLLNLLRSCETSSSLELIEKHMIVVLNQVCVSIAKSPELLEFCFDISTDHGPSRFVIFSLLIPFVHRDGLADKPSAQGITTGQQARDALLLIMQLSHRNEQIAKYIVENTNFCPILATGLSALYSDLPHQIGTNNDEWFILTKNEWSQSASLVQFMNSLQFCNDVIQIAHPSIGHHLLQYIYHGFLIPVLGPSIYQNTMDEVIAATAYLDLFLRTIYEPALLKVFLKFILCAKIDEIGLLDTLIQRINVTTKLGLISLGLFHTLINLNCEDIMYRLVFMYLTPCRHVMWSQRRHIVDMEIYGKNAERFLSLQSSFVNKNDTTNSTDRTQAIQVHFEERDKSHERYESTFAAYLEDAHFNIVRCRVACRCWSAPYDGETPSSDAVIGEIAANSLTTSVSTLNTDNDNSQKSDYLSTNTANQNLALHLERNVAASHDSGIHEEGLIEVNAQIELTCKASNSSFQLPSWLANNQPIPDELLAKRSTIKYHSYFHDDDDDDDDDDESDDYDRPSSFYAFSFIDFSNEQDDMWSVKSLNTSDNLLQHEIKTCVETLNTCLDQFREMNEQTNEIDENISNLLNELIDQIEYSLQNESSQQTVDIAIDYDLFNELFNKKLTLNEFLSILDRLTDIRSSKKSSKTGKEVLSDLLQLSEQIEQHRAQSITEPGSNADKDKQSSQSTNLPNSILPPSISMDVSLFSPNDFSNLTQSTLFPTSIQHQTSTNGNKPADIGPFLRTIFSKLENMVQNSLYVNLLLTGIISRLAHYSQPLLRSLLLNHSLVLETNVKSLFQILSNLKSKLETISQTYNNFGHLVQLAQELLYQRENATKEFYETSSRTRSPSRTRSKSADPGREEERVFFEVRQIPRPERTSTRSRLMNFFRGRSRAAERNDTDTQDHDHSQITFIDQTSMKFINIRENHTRIPVNEWDDPKTRNVAYCAVIFNEFLKELAAITLEHSVQQFDDDLIFEEISSNPFLF